MSLGTGTEGLRRGYPKALSSLFCVMVCFECYVCVWGGGWGVNNTVDRCALSSKEMKRSLCDSQHHRHLSDPNLWRWRGVRDRKLCGTGRLTSFPLVTQIILCVCLCLFAWFPLIQVALRRKLAGGGWVWGRCRLLFPFLQKSYNFGFTCSTMQYAVY